MPKTVDLHAALDRLEQREFNWKKYMILYDLALDKGLKTLALKIIKSAERRRKAKHDPHPSRH